MTNYSKITLKRGKEAAVKRFHPWIFSGAIFRITGSCKEGDIVEVFSSEDEFLATGHYFEGSIAIKIFSFERQEIDFSFWKKKIKDAYDLRTAAGLTNNPLTNAYRLVFTEGDSLPGLIIDFYNGTAVIQTHSMGMHLAKPFITQALQEIYGDRIKSVFDKSSDTMTSQSGKDAGSRISNASLYGEGEKGMIQEMGHSFMVDWEKGQKTGFFLDQRTNRMLAQFYAKDKKVLNAFCYSGAFSVFALKGGASMVHSVDSSRQAIEWTEENLTLNGIDKSKHLSIVADAKKYLESGEEKYDMIILDPPAFAKHHNITHNALQAYRYINAQAISKLTTGGILFTFSCSQAVSDAMFQSALMAAALETGRDVRILHRLSQGPDHPVSIYHPEGEYLKGLVLMVR